MLSIFGRSEQEAKTRRLKSIEINWLAQLVKAPTLSQRACIFIRARSSKGPRLNSWDRQPKLRLPSIQDK